MTTPQRGVTPTDRQYAMSIADRQVTVAEAAVLFGIPRWKLYRWIRHGAFAPVSASYAAGCKAQVSYFRLSEVAAAVAADHERHAAPRPHRQRRTDLCHNSPSGAMPTSDGSAS